MMKIRISLATLILVAATGVAGARAEDKKPRVAISFAREKSAAPLDGRMLLLISKDDSKEPRFQINDGPTCQQIFGIDVDGLAPGADAIFDGSALGFPV